MLSVVIPTLNAAATLERTLASVAEAPMVEECVVVDGGSNDNTAELAESHGCRVVSARRGRGPQLHAGARAAAGEWLLFLHADTALAAEWAPAAAAFMEENWQAERAACFRLTLDDEARGARRVERLVAWRTRTLGLPYGDQGLLISRGFYDALGGFPDQPLMEDVHLARRIGKHRLVCLDVPATTSAGRYLREGYWLRPARNLLCLGLYMAGMPAHWVKRLYG